MVYRMKSKEPANFPKPPSLVGALTAGFDTAASKIYLILFPLVLDLLIWFGPHIRLTDLINRFFEDLLALSLSTTPQTVEMVQQNQEIWLLISEQLNFLAVLRTYPVGIPSLMASRMPVETPGIFQNAIIDISSFGSAFTLWLALSIAGMTAAAFYFSAVAKAASPLILQDRDILYDWPRSSIQVVLLAIFWLAVIVAVTIPAILIISVAALISPALSQLTIFLFLAVLIWMVFPLLLSPHGIFHHKSSAFLSMKRSYYITRVTLPYTGLFFFTVFILSQGLNILWRIPPDNSWFSLVGVLGHSFVTTGLLAASFIYYREADRFSTKMQTRLSQLVQLR
jgi:hypothetical protein